MGNNLASASVINLGPNASAGHHVEPFSCRALFGPCRARPTSGGAYFSYVDISGHTKNTRPKGG